MVVLTASISDGVAFLEQHPERLTISRKLHTIIPLISVEGIERLEAFLAKAKKQVVKCAILANPYVCMGNLCYTPQWKAQMYRYID